MLRRVVYTSRSIGSSGLSTVSLAHILGACERNNRRDQVTSGMIIHGDRILQALEGAAADVEKALGRIKADARHTDLTIVLDAPAARRLVSEPIVLCDDPEAFLRIVGLPSLSAFTVEAAEVYLEYKQAA